MKTILGKKMGMTQIFTEHGAVIPVTVIQAGPMTVTQIKTVETDGYDAVQFGFEDAKPQRVNKPMTGHFSKNDIAPKKHLAEFRPCLLYTSGREPSVSRRRQPALWPCPLRVSTRPLTGPLFRHGLRLCRCCLLYTSRCV